MTDKDKREHMKINLGQIDFTNCMPVNYSFHKWHLESIIVSNGYPTFINQLFKDEMLHIAPISSIEYIKNKKDFSLIKSACISSDGEVGSVMLFSNHKITDLEGKRIAVPHTSSTSIELLKIILDEYGVNIENCSFKLHKYEYSLAECLEGRYDAVLFIGDPALIANNKEKCPYKFDLGLEWKKITGYPMVFGTWVAWSDWANIYKDDFEWIRVLLDKAVDAGLTMYFNEIVDISSKKLKLEKNVVEDYLKNKILYKPTDNHFKSLELFEEKYFYLNE